MSRQPGPAWIALIAESGVLIALAGCAVLTHLPRPDGLLGLGQTPAQALDDGYEDYAGVIHIHTTSSHDAHGRFEDVVRIANAQGLHYVILTEHNTLQPLREGHQGWHGSVLALIGMEISTRGGHYLALNVTEEIDRNKLTTQQVIDEVNRQGGFGFIAHPYFKKARWTDWAVTGFTGVEAYNVAHDTLDENRMRLVLWTFTAAAEPFYLSLLDRPYDPLATWDELISRHGRVVGIGSADAHEFHTLGLKFAPYEIMFQMARTHVLAPPGELTDQVVYAALRQGHAYLSIELAVPAKGFEFVAATGEQIRGIMGDEVVLEPELRLVASLPFPAQLALFRDGERIALTTAQAWEIPVTQPGAYRLEATRHNTPWIISNPIYVRASQAAAPR